MPPPPRAALNGQSLPQTGGKAATLGALAPITTPRIVLNCVEGWGKTSCGAFAPEPVILCARGENGYQTLLGAGLVPNIPGAMIESWSDLLATLDAVAAEGSHKTVALDAIDGFEAMCHQHVGQRDFKGDMGPRGFLNYHKGYDVAVGDWKGMLAKLDAIHAQGTAILLLSHCIDKTISNPMGEDYARFIGGVHPKTWMTTKRWADAVLFGTFRTIVDTKDGKGKGIGGTDRVLYCEHRDAYDAKNRYRMPAELEIPADPSRIWTTITAAMTARKG